MAPPLDPAAPPPQSLEGEVIKNISWNGSQWECQSFSLRVKRPQDGSLVPVEIDPKQIKVASDPDWLELAEIKKEKDSCQVEMKIRPGIVIRPPEQYAWDAQGNIKSGQQVTYQLGEEVKPQPPRANDLPQVKVTVTVQLQAEGLLSAATALAGMVPGGAAAVGAGLGLSQVVTYVVQPPRVQWLASVTEPIRLSGPGDLLRPEEEPESLADDPQAIRIQSHTLPPGWLEQVTVVAALSQVSRKLDIELTTIEPAPEVVDELGAFLKTKSNRSVLCPRDDIPAEPGFPNAMIELVMITQSRYLGVQVQKGVYVPAEALNVAIYFRNMPAQAHAWQPALNFFDQDLSKVAVIPKEKLASPPALCLLGVQLRYSLGWAEPAVHWYTEDEFEALELDLSGENGGLDDTFQQPATPATVYQAPSLSSWEAASKPALRNIVCLVGSGPPGPSEPVPEHPDLYFTAPVETEIDLVARTRKLRLKIRIGPREFLTGDQLAKMNLYNPGEAEKSLVRDITLDLEFM